MSDELKKALDTIMTPGFGETTTTPSDSAMTAPKSDVDARIEIIDKLRFDGKRNDTWFKTVVGELLTYLTAKHDIIARLTADLARVEGERDEAQRFRWYAEAAEKRISTAHSEIVSELREMTGKLTAAESEAASLRAELVEARGEALEKAARLVDGIVVDGRYVSWPCWNPNGNVAHDSEPARLTLALAAEIRALAVKPQGCAYCTMPDGRHDKPCPYEEVKP